MRPHWPWMAPQGAPRVKVVEWDTHAVPRDLVIETFGCHPPPLRRRMARREQPPVWIKLKYLSAEAYVERSHGLRSPRLAGPGRGLGKWFFYPGFEPRTGGLLREPDDGAPSPSTSGLAALARPGAPAAERVVSLFCYASAPVRELLQALS